MESRWDAGSLQEPHTANSPVQFLHVFPGFDVGGAELRVARTINHIGQRHKHAILSINGTSQAAAYLRYDLQVPIYKAPRKSGWVRFPIALWKSVRTLRPSVVLTYNWGATDTLIGAWLARFQPVIHNECGMSADVDGNGWRRRVVRRLLLPRCHRVVVTAQSFHELVVQDYGVKPDRVAFIKTGVDTARFTPGEDATLRQSMGLHAGGVVFGYVGTLRPSKNIPMLIRAFAAARRPADRLAFFGDGPERESLSALASELGVSDAVYFHGHIEEPENAYWASDIYVTTSRSEAASNSLLESMACGLPAVSTDIADNRRILSAKNRDFVYDFDDFDGYTNGLRTLAENATLRQELGALNRRRVVEEYPIERMYAEYAALWQGAARLQTTSNVVLHEK